MLHKLETPIINVVFVFRIVRTPCVHRQILYKTKRKILLKRTFKMHELIVAQRNMECS